MEEEPAALLGLGTVGPTTQVCAPVCSSDSRPAMTIAMTAAVTSISAIV
jgi:hypothetical protein